MAKVPCVNDYFYVLVLVCYPFQYRDGAISGGVVYEQVLVTTPAEADNNCLNSLVHFSDIRFFVEAWGKDR